MDDSATINVLLLLRFVVSIFVNEISIREIREYKWREKYPLYGSDQTAVGHGRLIWCKRRVSWKKLTKLVTE